MPCRIQRLNGQISKVYLADGKTESKTYLDLVSMVHNLPDDQRNMAHFAVRKHVGKYVKDTSDPGELALGLYLNLHTSEFKKWFGDWENNPDKSSKVVNELGEPQLVFHGTMSPKLQDDSFKGNVFYFTDDKWYAQNHKGEIMSRIMNTIPAFLNIRDPYHSWKPFADAPATVQEVKNPSIVKSMTFHDGAIGKDFGQIDGDTYVAFNSRQIKSPINDGSFSVREQIYKSVKTAKTKKLISSVQKTAAGIKELMRTATENIGKAERNKEFSNEQRADRVKHYTDIRKKLQLQYDELVKNNTADYVFIQASSDLNMVADILNGDMVTLTEVRFAQKTLDLWKNLADFLGVETIDDLQVEEQRNMAYQLDGQYRRLQSYVNKFNGYLLREAYDQKMSNDPKLSKDDLTAFKNVDFLTAKARDLTNTGDKLANMLAKVINNANQNIDKEHNRNYHEIDKQWNKIKNHPEIVKNGFSIFIKQQSDKFGRDQMGLIGPFSQSFYDARSMQFRVLKDALEKAAGDPKLTKDAYSRFNKWMGENTILFNAVPFVDENGRTRNNAVEQQKVIDELVAQGFTRDEIKTFVKDAQKNYRMFLDHAERQRHFWMVDIRKGELQVPEDKTEDEFLDEMIADWKAERDPLKHIQDTISGTKSGTFKGYRYTVTIPVKTIKGKESGHYDENFRKVAADKDLFEFYTFVRDFLSKQLSNLPKDKTHGVQSNFLPIIADDMAAEFALNSPKAVMHNVGKWFLDALTSVEPDDSVRIDPTTGKPRNEFRARFLDGNTPVEERSKDLVVMMKMFSDISIIYKHKLHVQDEVEQIKSTIQKAEATVKTDRFGKVVKIPEAPKNLQEMVTKTIDMSFYHKPPLKEGVSNRKFYSAAELLTLGLYKSDQYKQAASIEEQIKDLTRKLEDETLTDSQRGIYEKQVADLRKQYKNLGGQSFSISDLGDSLIKLTRLKGIAFNPFSAFRNLLVGGINNYIHAYGGEDFNVKQLNQASAMMKDSVMKYLTWGNKESEMSEKILRILLDSGAVDGEDNIFKAGVLDKNSTMETIKKYIPNPFGLMQSTDYFFKGQTAMAMILNHKVKTEKGEVSLIDVLNPDLSYNEEKYGKWDAAANGGKQFDTVYDDYLNKYSQLAKKLHGFSGDRLSLAGKETILGRMLFLFKTWLPETLATRFEGKRYDPMLQREVKGYYRAITDYKFKIIKLMWQAAFNKEMTGVESEVDAANIRKLLAEFAAIGTIAALYSLTLLLAPDEDDDDRKQYNLMANQILLLNRDLTYYMNPGSFGDLTQNTIPVINTVTQMGDAIKALGYHAMGVEDNNGDEQYDSERTLSKITKAMPYLNNYNRMVYYSDKLGEVQ